MDSERLVAAAHSQQGGFGGEPERLCLGAGDCCGCAAAMFTDLGFDPIFLDAASLGL